MWTRFHIKSAYYEDGMYSAIYVELDENQAIEFMKYRLATPIEYMKYHITRNERPLLENVLDYEFESKYVNKMLKVRTYCHDELNLLGWVGF